MKFTYGLNAIVGSQVKLDLLRYMVNNPGEFTGRDLASRSGCSHTQVNRSLNELAGSGIVDRKKAGRSFLYSLNQRHILTNEIMNLFELEEGALDKVADMVKEQVGDSLKYLIIFGSVARKAEDQASDIDMVVAIEDGKMLDDPEELSYRISNESVAITGSPAHPILVEEKELKAKKSKSRREMWLDVFGDKPVIAYDFTRGETKRKDIPKGEYLLASLGV
jgi:predicted nucleotidyltransferase